MGRVTKIKGRSSWYVEWTVAPRCYRRVKVPGTRLDAERLLKDVELKAARERLGLGEPTAADLALEELAGRWREHVLQRSRPATWRSYELGIRQVVDWLVARGNPARLVSDIRLEDIEAFAAWKRSHPTLDAKGRPANGLKSVSARTVNMHVGALKTMLAWGLKEGYVRNNPLARWRPLRGPQVRERRSLTATEAQDLVEASPPDLADVWRFFLGTGLRAGELAGLEWRDVDWEARAIQVKGEAGKSKSKRNRSIPLREDCLAVLTRRRVASAWSKSSGDRSAEGALVFTNSKGRHWKDRLPRRLKGCLKKADLPLTLDVHCLRHTFATHLLSAGVDVKTVQELLGHSTAMLTLDIYGHALAARKRTAVEALTMLAPAQDPHGARKAE